MLIVLMLRVQLFMLLLQNIAGDEIIRCVARELLKILQSVWRLRRDKVILNDFGERGGLHHRGVRRERTGMKRILSDRVMLF